MTDTAAVNALFAEHRPERLIAGAAITPSATREARAILPLVEVNILGALRTLEVGFAAGVQRAVFLSSASVYGDAEPVSGVLDELASFPRPTGAYGIAKFAAEQLALRMGLAKDVDIRVARIGTVFGPWERDTGLRDTLSQIHQVMELSGAGTEVVLPREGPRDFVYAPDVARVIATLLDAPEARGIFNIGLGMEWSVADWCRALAEQRPLSWRIAAPGEAANVNYHAPNDRPPLAIRRLQDDLGVPPFSGLHEAMPRYLAWLDGEKSS